MDKVFKVFIDFDGTITKKDVGEHLFLEFGDTDKANAIIDKWINGNISSIEMWQRLFATIPNPNLEAINDFLNTIEIDDHFVEFIEHAAEKNYDVYIVSDGFDFYINPVLKNYGLEHLPVYSNKINIVNGNLIPTFPYTDEDCKRCANCKRNHILANSSDDDYTIYIGDGHSDICPIQFCDFVFAKDALLKYCELNRITYFPYRNFNDVKLRLKELEKKKRLKKRHQAQLKRKEAYMAG